MDKSDDSSTPDSLSGVGHAEPACTIALGSFCEAHGPTIIFSTQALSLDSLHLSEEQSKSPHKEICPLCESIPDDAGFISIDKSMGVAFVSKRTPSLLQDKIHRACVRSLSCEWVPQESTNFAFQEPARAHSVSFIESDNEPNEIMSPVFTYKQEMEKTPPIIPVMHGNKKSGYTLSLEFKMEDDTARGSVRWYVVNVTWTGSPSYLAAVACSQIVESIIEPLVRTIQHKAVTFNIREVENKRKRTVSRTKGCSHVDTRRSLAKIMDTTPHKLFEYFHKTFCNAITSIIKDSFYPLMKQSPQFSFTLSSPDSSPLGRAGGKESFDLAEFFSSLDDENAKTLLYNCLIGNQIIVRGACEEDVRTAVCSIAYTLLPQDLRGDVCEYSCTYKSFHEAHFLGLPLSAEVIRAEEVSSILDAFEEELLDFLIFRDEGNNTSDKYAGRAVLTLNQDLSKCSVCGAYFQTSIVDDMLASLRSSTARSRVALIHDRLITAAKLGYVLQSQGFFDDEPGTDKVLPLLGVQKNDLTVLKYWMSCIKKNFFRLRPKRIFE